MDAARDGSRVEQEEIIVGDEREERGLGSLLAAGWFRALLVLSALAVVMMVALPYLLDWFEPATSPPPMAAPARHEARFARAHGLLSGRRAVRPGPEQAPPAAAMTPTPGVARTVATRPPTLPSRPVAAAPSEAVPRVKAGADVPEPERSRPVLPTRNATAAETSQSHWVQLGLFKDSQNAERLARRLRDEGFSIQVASVTRILRGATDGDVYHLVRAGAFPDEAGATAAQADLKTRGYVGFVTEGAAK
jgi:cell division septation protein DedD